jgi:hypothetical protein
MESSRFDRLARAIGAPHTRRTAAALLATLVAVPLAGHPPAAAKKKKKVTLCLNGSTITVPRKKKGNFLKQGATPGACPPGGAPQGCPAGTKRCKGACIAAGACCTTSDCDPCLREVCIDGACECPGGMARDGDGVCSIFISCASAGQTVSSLAHCCSGRGTIIGLGQVVCIPGNNTCAIDLDCLHGQHCVGNLCAQAYINTVGDQCADRAFDICSVRTQCTTGRCEDNLCKTCASDAECRREPDPGHTCFCEDTVCLRRSQIGPVNSCSQCPANTAYCKPVSNTFVCYPLCGGR